MPKLNKNKFEDIHAKKSKKKGFLGIVETFVRSFRNLAFLIFLAPIGLLYLICLGVSLTPGVALYNWADQLTLHYHPVIHFLSLGFSIGAGYLLYGITLILVVPLVNFLIPLKVRPCKMTWYSLEVIGWYYHNALTQLVRYTFLELVNPTPFNIIFFKLMGMKIGKGVVINTSNISDPCLITLDDYVTIGGSATLFAHYGMKGYLVISTLHVKKGATIGLKASLFGDVVIGENAMVAPHSVVLPKTRVEDNSTFSNFN